MSTINHHHLLLIFDDRPLLIFPNPVLPEECICAKLGSNFYFFGGWKGFWGSKCDTDVYRIRESDLNDIEYPSERNTNGGKYLIKCASLHGEKHTGTSFVAENKLYVLSFRNSATQFEVFDPRLRTWRVLPHQPARTRRWIGWHVVVGNIVYFTYNENEVLSFHLEQEKWGVVITHDGFSVDLINSSLDPCSALLVRGDMAFGVMYELDKNVFDNYDYQQRADTLTIFATSFPCKGNFACHEFMQPSILDNKFMDAVNSTRCPHVTTKYFREFSDCIVALDGGKVLCVVSYGTDPVNYLTSHVTLTYFEVTPRCLKPKLLHTVQFVIRTVSLVTAGRSNACFADGL